MDSENLYQILCREADAAGIPIMTAIKAAKVDESQGYRWAAGTTEPRGVSFVKVRAAIASHAGA